MPDTDVHAELLVEAGARKGERVSLGEEPVIIGRDDGCLLKLTDNLVSREHCRVERRNGGWRVCDLESKNGTLLNGNPLKGEKSLGPGDRIQVGDSTLVFVPLDLGDVAAPAAVAAVDKPSRGRAEIAGEYRPGSDGRTLSKTMGREVLRAARQFRNAMGDLGKSADFAQVARAVLDVVLDVTPASRASLFEFDHGRGEVTRWEMRTDHKVDGDVTLGLADRIELDRSVVARSLSDGVGLLLQLSDLGEIAGDAARGWADETAPINFAYIPVPPEPGATLGLYLDSSRQDGSGIDADGLALATELFANLGPQLTQVQEMGRIKQENVRLRGELQGRVGKLLGSSPQMAELYRQIDRLSAVDSPVLVCGESGTGKELVARAIHSASRRSSEPFVAVNVAAVPMELVESELFGHVKGAFTGAVRNAIGRLEEAQAGTLFLDEIGELALAAQVKLLRVLEERRYRPLGSGREQVFHARIVAATNRDLAKLITDGRFREDLYFRLNVVEVEVPPLRDRGHDIGELAQKFVKTIGAEVGNPGVELSENALERLAAHSWPGNVRELRNAIERSLVLGGRGTLDDDDFAFLDVSGRFGAKSSGEAAEATKPPAPASVAGVPVAPPATSGVLSLREMECEHIQSALRACGGNKSKAARQLGIDRSTLYDKIKQYAIES